MIPGNAIDAPSYNSLLNDSGNIRLVDRQESTLKLTTINYDHPLFDGVFESRITNFTYPSSGLSYTLNVEGTPILRFEDGRPFLTQFGNVFFFCTPLEIETSDFIESPLVVPVFYTMSRFNLKPPQLYYQIGRFSEFDAPVTIGQDDVLKLESDKDVLIPEQQINASSVRVKTEQVPDFDGNYALTYQDSTLKYVSYNYPRSESRAIRAETTDLNMGNTYSSLEEVLLEIKSNANSNRLWKWFVIFALIFLLAEMLVLKFLK